MVFMCVDYLRVYKSTHKDTTLAPDSRTIEGISLSNRLLENKCNRITANESKMRQHDRNLIIVIDEEEGMHSNYSRFMHRFLMFHPEVVYLRSLTTFVDSWNMDKYDDGYIAGFIDKLYKCHSDVLSEFVYYSNAFLRQLERPEWCARKKPSSHLALGHTLGTSSLALTRTSFLGSLSKHLNKTDTICVPPPKKLFHKLCISHHLALQFSAAEYASLLERKTMKRNMKIVTLSKRSYKAQCHARARHFGSSSTYDDDNAEMFEMSYISLNDTSALNYCIQELCNFIDIYCNSSYTASLLQIALS